MVKTLLYTSNPDFVPTNFEQVENFAEASGKYYTCTVNDSKLRKGAHVVTSKGNNVYILEVGDGNKDYSIAKKSNITHIISVDYPFEDLPDWKKSLIPVEANNIRITPEGDLCVKTAQGYVSIDKDNNLTSYPEESTSYMPVYIITKPKDQLQIGEVIAINNTYAKVTEIKDNIITVIGYNGIDSTIHTIKNSLFNKEMVQVVLFPGKTVF